MNKGATSKYWRKCEKKVQLSQRCDASAKTIKHNKMKGARKFEDEIFSE